jgi:MoaA/NifB/PqqE/SkfB family radical SAM enzyme
MRCRTAIYHITLKCNLTCQHCYASSSFHMLTIHRIIVK